MARIGLGRYLARGGASCVESRSQPMFAKTRPVWRSLRAATLAPCNACISNSSVGAQVSHGCTAQHAQKDRAWWHTVNSITHVTSQFYAKAPATPTTRKNGVLLTTRVKRIHRREPRSCEGGCHLERIDEDHVLERVFAHAQGNAGPPSMSDARLPPVYRLIRVRRLGKTSARSEHVRPPWSASRAVSGGRWGRNRLNLGPV